MSELRWHVGSGVLELLQGDIARAEHDAVVNAANAGLVGGGGVDGAIHAAAGHADVQQACREIIARRGKLTPGEAVLTPGFRLRARHIIHTVGPIWQGGGHGEEAALRAAHANSLALAHEHGLATVAFPAISCGAYGYPVRLAARAALDELRKGLEAGLVERVSVFLFSQEALKPWSEAALELFGSP